MNVNDSSKCSNTMSCIEENYHVVLKKGTNMKVLKITRNGNVKFDKKNFSLDAAIGKPFGTSWEVQSGQVIPVQHPQLTSAENAKSADDNRDIQDDTESQKLQHDEITSLKEQGVSGEGIIERLVDNSVSFQNKTSYSQAKYIKRKTDKHLTRFTICKPSMRLVTEIHWRKTPSPKLIHLRPDTLAQMLTYSNIQSGSKVIVIEHCQGLLVAAALERLAGKGNLIHLHTEDIPVVVAEECFDFPKEYTDIVMRMQLQYFNKVLKADTKVEDPTNSNGEKEEDIEKEKNGQPFTETVAQPLVDTVIQPLTDTVTQPETEIVTQPQTETVAQTQMDKVAQPQEDTVVQPQIDTVAQPLQTDADALPQTETVAQQTQEESNKGRKRKYPGDAERIQRRMKREATNQKIANIMNEKDMDVIMVACRFNPAPILTHLLEYLGTSRSFVVYSNAKEPLVECYNQLKETGGVINIHFTETWLREYQVLENRTHPLVNMSGTGGYILAGTKVSTE